MTTNQLRWAEIAENKRHNVVYEQETARHNRAYESETQRHNVVNENQGWSSLYETQRSNLASEDIRRTTNSVSYATGMAHAAAAQTSANAAVMQAQEQARNNKFLNTLQVKENTATVGYTNAQARWVNARADYQNSYNANILPQEIVQAGQQSTVGKNKVFTSTYDAYMYPATQAVDMWGNVVQTGSQIARIGLQTGFGG